MSPQWWQKQGVIRATRPALGDSADSGDQIHDAYGKCWLFNADIECFQFFINKGEAKSSFWFTINSVCSGTAAGKHPTQ